MQHRLHWYMERISQVKHRSIEWSKISDNDMLNVVNSLDDVRSMSMLTSIISTNVIGHLTRKSIVITENILPNSSKIWNVALLFKKERKKKTFTLSIVFFCCVCQKNKCQWLLFLIAIEARTFILRSDSRSIFKDMKINIHFVSI